MKWMRERDLLIAQTMAFVQSVTGKKPEADMTVAASFLAVETSQTAVTAAPMPDIEALMAETIAAAEPPREASTPVQTIARADLRNGFQSEISEIKARVADFRAHQARFSQEREAYCSATMAKVHATLREMPSSPRVGK
ncbi:hypothetical protein FFI89_021060 [Bradyrhizobium sp. KBS0727]|uniref:hypothetical protein n=1 Tax=unclassified Bradyrhizobium TaxID=2631580 RepID=UPI00110DBD15|nr:MULTISPECIES: hypothetical protein [unclassified Bradyrhizobium]QDW39408.1 hypothetical protein FFI71_021065 [Bradyrhizobium sp. KBS0725]QDW46011.1 hypothetical protein FFI89_021060 [Bradyrhizobium sp. KBS0727]